MEVKQAVVKNLLMKLILNIALLVLAKITDMGIQIKKY